VKVAVYGINNGWGRDKPNLLGNAFRTGFRRHGINCLTPEKFDGNVIADVAVAYGWINELTTHLFSKYKAAGKHFVFLDLGYWDRGTEGHYRLGIDDWDTAVRMRRNCPPDRFNRLKVNVRDEWDHTSNVIMIVGMSGKAAWTHGYKDGQWEQQTKDAVEKIFPQGSVYVRQKPNKQNLRTTKIGTIDAALREAYFVVSHHSNVAVDCLVAGIPFYAKKGVGSLLSNPDFSEDTLLNPTHPTTEDKMQLLYDTAYAQWTPNEMRSGECWDYIKGVLTI